MSDGVVTATSERGAFLCRATGFLIAFKACITFLWFQSNPKLGAAVEVSGMIAWLSVAISFTVINPPQSVHRLGIPRALQWSLVYVALAGISLMWTAAGSLSAAVAYWAGTAAEVAVVVLLLSDEPIENNVERIMQGFIGGAGFLVLIAWYAPAMDDMRLGNEEFMHPNLIGFEFAIAAFFAVYLSKNNKSWGWVAFGFVVTMVRTLSKGTIVGFIFAGLYYLVGGLKTSRKVRLYVGLTSTAVLTCFWGLLETYLDLYTQGSNLETLTGRTYIWSQALDLAVERPWFGYGFDSFRWVVPPLGEFQPGHAHNEVIQQFFAYGIVGLIVVGAVYWTFYRQVRVSRNTGLKSLAMAMLILVLVRGLVDTDRFQLCFPLWLVTTLSMALARVATPQRSS